MICNKCGRQKRDCNSGCRNTFIIPYASGSNGAIPPGDAESLRMLIKVTISYCFRNYILYYILLKKNQKHPKERH